MRLRDAPVLIMEGSDTEEGVLQGHPVGGLQARGQRKLPALIFTHSVLTCACAALCVYTLYRLHLAEDAWNQNNTPLPVDKGIYLNMRQGAFRDPSPYLNFTVTWNNSLKLEHGSEVIVPLAGPYVFYICALVKGNGTKGNLTLSQGKTNVFIELSAQSDNTYVRHQRVISLYEKETVIFTFRNTYEPYLYLDVLRVGLHYLLGAQAFQTPYLEASV